MISRHHASDLLLIKRTPPELRIAERHLGTAYALIYRLGAAFLAQGSSALAVATAFAFAEHSLPLSE